MKRLILLATAVSVIGLGHSVTANEQPPAAPEDAPLASTAPSSVIDGVEVPYWVLNSIQMENQGYAVTKVFKQSRGGNTFYLLQASKDTQALPHESIYFLFDKDWKFSGQQTAPSAPAPAPTKKVEAPKPVQQQPTQPEPTPAPAAEPKPVQQQDQGGRGGGDAVNDKPVEKPQERRGNGGGND